MLSCSIDKVSISIRNISTVPPICTRSVSTTRESVVDGLKLFCTTTMVVRILSAEEDWLPCYPFTLPFTPANTMSFVMGRVIVFVLTELTQVQALFSTVSVRKS